MMKLYRSEDDVNEMKQRTSIVYKLNNGIDEYLVIMSNAIKLG